MRIKNKMSSSGEIQQGSGEGGGGGELQPAARQPMKTLPKDLAHV